MIDRYICSALSLWKCNPFFNYKYICDDCTWNSIDQCCGNKNESTNL